MGRMLLVVLAVLLALGLAVAGCRKDNGDGGGGIQYQPAPTGGATAAEA
jgi:hypothetical protein